MFFDGLFNQISKIMSTKRNLGLSNLDDVFIVLGEKSDYNESFSQKLESLGSIWEAIYGFFGPRLLKR